MSAISMSQRTIGIKASFGSGVNVVPTENRNASSLTLSIISYLGEMANKQCVDDLPYPDKRPHDFTDHRPPLPARVSRRSIVRHYRLPWRRHKLPGPPSLSHDYG